MAFQIYLIGFVDSLRFGISLAMIGLLIVLFLILLSAANNKEKSKEAALIKAIHRVIALGLILFAARIVIPNSKTLAAMVLIPKIYAGEQLNLPEKSLPKLEREVGEWIKEIRE